MAPELQRAQYGLSPTDCLPQREVQRVGAAPSTSLLSPSIQQGAGLVAAQWKNGLLGWTSHFCLSVAAGLSLGPAVQSAQQLLHEGRWVERLDKRSG